MSIYKLDLEGARRRSGVTLSKLARMSGIPQPSLARYASGRSDITLGQIGRISAALNIGISKIVVRDSFSDAKWRRMLEGRTQRAKRTDRAWVSQSIWKMQQQLNTASAHAGLSHPARSNPYMRYLTRLNHGMAGYVIIGTAGINYYAESSEQVEPAGAFDILLRPDTANVLNVMKILHAGGCTLSIGRNRLEADSHKFIGRIPGYIKEGAPLTAVGAAGERFELRFKAYGFSYDQLAARKNFFRVGKIAILVANLADLLRMKEISGRRQDGQFLQRYREYLKSGI